jgi:hypothetical protein
VLGVWRPLEEDVEDDIDVQEQALQRYLRIT